MKQTGIFAFLEKPLEKPPKNTFSKKKAASRKVDHSKYIVYPEGKIEAKRVQNYNEILARLDSGKDHFHPSNIQTLKDFILDAYSGITLPNRAESRVGNKRLLKYIQDLKKLDNYFNKPFKDITAREISLFVNDLDEGKIKTPKGTPYAEETRTVIKKLIKKFYKWLEGENYYYPNKVRGIPTGCRRKDYKAITEEQFERMLTRLTSTTSYYLLRNKALLVVLYMLGVRVEELINIRLKHISLNDEGEYLFRIEYHKSKSRKRTIEVPDKYSEHIEAWLDIHPGIPKTKPLDGDLFPPETNLETQLFVGMHYNMIRLVVANAGKRIDMKLTPHSMRHGSATYWCQELSSYELCYRFGWAMYSKMPGRYIDQEGMRNKKRFDRKRQSKIKTLEEKNLKMAQRLNTMESYFKKYFKEEEEEARRILRMAKERGVAYD